MLWAVFDPATLRLTPSPDACLLLAGLSGRRFKVYLVDDQLAVSGGIVENGHAALRRQSPSCSKPPRQQFQIWLCLVVWVPAITYSSWMILCASGSTDAGKLRWCQTWSPTILPCTTWRMPIVWASGLSCHESAKVAVHCALASQTSRFL